MPDATAREDELMEDILRIQNVSAWRYEEGFGVFRARKKIQVLRDVSFSIHENEFFGLVGESGSGKSTLADAIIGLSPFSGSITIDGTERGQWPRKQFARTVAAVFQDTSGALNPKRSVGFTMEEPLKIHGIGTASQRKAQALEMLSLVGLDPSCAARLPQELSGGQRQRVCIGAALMLKPRLLVADEAISALDVSVGAQILNLFRDMRAKMPFALLFISHNLGAAHYLCDRIAALHHGSIVEIGSADDICLSPSHPYTKSLLDAIPRPPNSFI